MPVVFLFSMLIAFSAHAQAPRFPARDTIETAQGWAQELVQSKLSTYEFAREALWEGSPERGLSIIRISGELKTYGLVENLVLWIYNRLGLQHRPEFGLTMIAVSDAHTLRFIENVIRSRKDTFYASETTFAIFTKAIEDRRTDLSAMAHRRGYASMCQALFQTK